MKICYDNGDYQGRANQIYLTITSHLVIKFYKKVRKDKDQSMRKFELEMNAKGLK